MSDLIYTSEEERQLLEQVAALGYVADYFTIEEKRLIVRSDVGMAQLTGTGQARLQNLRETKCRAA